MRPALSLKTAPEAMLAPGASAPRRRGVAWRLALVFLVSCVAYANSVPNGFTLDDKAIVEHNRMIRGLDRLPEIWSSPYWTNHRYLKYYRPLTITTYALNYSVHGLRPAGYHAVNVLLHAAVSTLIVLLALKLSVPLAGALLGGLLFAVHPVHSEAVSGVVGRAELLAALAFVGGILFWLRYRERGRPRDLAGLICTFALGNLCKEQVIVLPALFVATELAYHRLRDPAGRRRLAWSLFGCAVVVALLFATRQTVTGSMLGATLATHPPTPGLLYGEPFQIRVLTFFKVLKHAAHLLIFPIWLSADYGYNTIPIPRGIERSVALGGGVALLCIIGLLRAWAIPGRFLMGTLAFLAYLPVSNLLVASPLLLTERALYVPTIGLAVILGDWLVSGRLSRKSTGRIAVSVLVAVTIMLWGARTVARNPVWRDQLSLFEATVVSSPRSALMRMSYGIELLNLGRPEEAARQLETAVAIQPNLAIAHYKLSLAYQELNEPQKAEEAIRALLHFRMDRPTPWLQLARVLIMQGRAEEAETALRRGLAFNPGNPAIQELLKEIGTQGRGGDHPGNLRGEDDE